MTHIICSSDGLTLNFKTDEEYQHYQRQRLLLDLATYAKLRKKYGIWASNQNKYVSSTVELNEWDSTYMETQLAVNYNALLAAGMV
jgi:hypothetical protein